MFRLTALILSLLLLSSLSCSRNGHQDDPDTQALTSYVDTRIGTGDHGHVFVGASVPFGLVQLGPTSIPVEWDFVSGYHDSDSTVIGFSHTHLSGTGIGDLFDITVMPVVGEVTYARGSEDDPKSGLWSYQDRTQEKTEPGYYSTYLTRYGVRAELTATARMGFHRYTFDKTGPVGFVFDLVNGGCWDQATDAYLKQVDQYTLEGYRYSKGWASDQRVYFTAKFDHPIDSVKVIADAKTLSAEGRGRQVYAHVYMQLSEQTPVELRVALSPTSIENARKNASAEDNTFDSVHTAALEQWENQLSKIRIESNSLPVKRNFYTAMYHSMIAPSIFCDVNGDYYGADFQNHSTDTFTNYTTLSLWDTYRAAHPLMTIIHPEIMPDMAATFMNIFEQQGKLPVWHLWGCETNTMVGNPGVCVLADAILKGYVADTENAYKALKASCMLDERGQKERKVYGYLPKDKMKESVAYDMEYAIADWAVAQVAKKLEYEEDYQYFLARSQSYHQLFDPSCGFVRGKNSNGSFDPLSSFDPYASDHRGDDYCEGNAWQYTFLVPHDVHGMIDCFGSEEKFLSKLDSLFIVDSKLTGNSSPDISGMIGQYAHGNEPSHHTIYLYSMIGHRDKAAPLLRKVMHTLYTDKPDGLCGNEDVGQMSAWYILSSIGLYQIEPAGGRYYFGSPIVDRAELKVSGGTFTIDVHDNSDENMYIRRVELNGKEYTLPYITFEDIVSGGKLDIYMSKEPSERGSRAVQ